ncbi:MAG TPA: lipoyl(octanoyl) transferase LipB [Chromatiaceae bacterium]|jgi:lipoyl(octanoyl) transferase|nr:lipoyl(octanoyl) transferase LipB [Chromatiaceae bacterium]HIN81701.1 lipoyl(octanoyl) transferase LipB [Chromatiales bacterium]HIA08064.1 lipoyl(octanoyl) transferase LipB [Chromatiaceae bacterium]HIB83525.1 lipoyl(octanoyl) transferase LipB [Chromatiaceae bacterium]HIO14354.1 lipoyl(octanoyl) transferase LipB [Chromatiales bacterium]
MLVVRHLGLQDYQPVWRAMKSFTERRGAADNDELWVMQHPPVYTLGLNGKPEHLLADSDIPLIQIDRGGQITYHGPGQLVLYALIDLRRHTLGVRQLVTALEQSVVCLLRDYAIDAQADPAAPGVYVAADKIAALGIRIRKHCSYHGLSLNIDMDLAPYANINPCGFTDLQVTQLADLGCSRSSDEVETDLCAHLAAQLGYTTYLETETTPTDLRS